MDKKIRLGVIGCGGIANSKHMPAEKRNPASTTSEVPTAKSARTTANF